ncbi:hypothetical protein ACF1A5_19310 [Streptomyces sp. NPDC014864]|uniref:hypothetical protein n=1 Tax=Streptomyces sp. NPDC014864 TaxID=3364924 RepID=UPI003700A34F
MRILFWCIGFVLMVAAFFSFGLANTAWYERKNMSSFDPAGRRSYSRKIAIWIVVGFLFLVLMWFVLGL